MIEDKYRLLIPENEDENLTVKLVGEPYDGITYQYTYVKLPEKVGENYRLQFRYVLLEGNEPKDIIPFETLLGDILVDIIIKKQKLNAFRTNNTE